MPSDSTAPQADMIAFDPVGRFTFAVGRLNRMLRTARGGLSHGLLSALATVTKYGPVRLADLAQIEAVAAPTATRIVAELEAKGLVSRAADPHDGRASRIEVTSAGMDALMRAKLAREEVIAELLRSLDEGELASIRAALPALERMIGEGQPPQ